MPVHNGKRLLVVGNYFNAHEPFADLFEKTCFIDAAAGARYGEFTPDDVVLFMGGADISPSLYDQKPNRYCGVEAASQRDLQEMKIFQNAKKAGSKFLGICRGAQLLCALSGGSLIQHVTHHGEWHNILTKDGRVMEVSSTHHQMMNPFGTKHELIAWAQEKLSTCYLVEECEDVEMEVEPEVVWFPKTKALAMQYHPEFMYSEHEGVKYARELVSKYLIGE